MSRTRFATYPLLGLMLACGAQASPPPAAARSNQPNPSAGICGGFERRALADKPISLLNGRLSIRPLEGSLDAARLADVMSASPSNETETRLFLRDGESK